MSDTFDVYDDWDLEPNRSWRDRFDWLAPRRWMHRPRTQLRNGYECQFDYATMRWQFTHRIVAEAALGRPIPAGYEVHHINGNKRDNSPSNLAVIPKDLHRQIHAAARAAAGANRSYVNALVRAFHELGGIRGDLINGGASQPAAPAPSPARPSPPTASTSGRTLSASAAAILAGALVSRGGGGSSGCPRCGGGGYLPQFSHVEGGVCFLCGGGGHYAGNDPDDDEDDDMEDDLDDNDPFEDDDDPMEDDYEPMEMDDDDYFGSSRWDDEY